VEDLLQVTTSNWPSLSNIFQESQKQTIQLSESAQTIAALLDELYDTYNSTIGSIFTNFALCPEIEKERGMAQLLDLFIASDKVGSTHSSKPSISLTYIQYSLEKVKRKVAFAIIDRLPFIKDPLMVVDIATNIHHDQFPYMDGGLRQAMVVQINARLPAIVSDEGAWTDLTENKAVLKALHVHQCETRDDVGASDALTPPLTPVKKGRAQGGG
jgi:histone acetyltransferase HTATIP